LTDQMFVLDLWWCCYSRPFNEGQNSWHWKKQATWSVRNKI